MNPKIFFLFLSMFTTLCFAANSETIQRIEFPDWFYKPPVNRKYVYAIGISDINCNKESAFKEADKFAKITLSLFLNGKIESRSKNLPNDSFEKRVTIEFRKISENDFSIIDRFYSKNGIALSLARIKNGNNYKLEDEKLFLSYILTDDNSNESVKFSLRSKNDISISKEFSLNDYGRNSFSIKGKATVRKECPDIKNEKMFPKSYYAEFEYKNHPETDLIYDPFYWLTRVMNDAINIGNIAAFGQSWYLPFNKHSISMYYLFSLIEAMGDISDIFRFSDKKLNLKKTGPIKLLNSDVIYDETSASGTIAVVLNIGAYIPKDILGPIIDVSYGPKLKGFKKATAKKEILISGKVWDDSGVFEVSANGQNIRLSKDGKFKFQTRLAYGNNEIELQAKDIHNNQTIRKLNIVREDAADKTTIESNVKKTQHNYIFAVAIDDYTHWPKLSNAVNDVQAIVDILTKKYQFEPSEVLKLYNKQASLTNLYRTFKKLALKVKEQDNLIILFSGHGHYNKTLDEGYWIPFEAHKDDESSFLPNSTISKFISAINSHHTLLIADACFSGSLLAKKRGGFSENVEKFKSRWALTSGRVEYVSDGRIGQHSPFAQYLIKFLETNNKNKLPVSELVQYVKVSVANNSDQTPIGSPLRNAGDEGGELVLYLKKK